MQNKQEKPNFSQVPNWFLDNIQNFTNLEKEIILFICRKTIGWHKELHTCSISYIMEGINYKCKSKIIKTLKMLLEEGVILRKKSKNSYKYSLGIYAPPKSNGDHLITISNGDHLITQVKKQRIRKETNINNINIINTEKSVLLKNLDENVKLKKTFGNPDINLIIQKFKVVSGLGVLDGSIKENRMYANLLIKKLKGIENAEKLINVFPQSKFWSGKISSIKSLYFKVGAIVLDIQNNSKNNKFISFKKGGSQNE